MTPADAITERLIRVWEPEFAGSMWQWAEGMDMPQSTLTGGVFAPELSPWLLEIFDALSNPRIREVVVVAPAGGAKSMLAEIFIAWIVKNAPGRTYYVCQTDDDAKDAMEGRIMPFLEANNARGIVLPTDRTKKRATKVIFPGMEFYALGANENNAQSKRVRYLIMDETAQYDPGLIEAFRARHNAVSGAKTLIITTGGITDDQTDAAFRAGDMREYQVVCPECGRAQPMRNVRLRYETSERTLDAQGNYRLSEVRESVRYHCEDEEKGCRWTDDERTRRRILQGAHYAPTNLNAPPDIASFHYPYQIVPWLSWGKGVEKWISANRAAAMGIMDVRREYVQKWLAESWDESPREEDGIQTGHRVGAYLKRSAWDEELTRFCTADQQARKFYAVCKAWAADGSSRTVDAAVLDTFEDYEEFRKANHTEARRTAVDIAFNTSISQQRCAQYGWRGLWGDERKHWPHDIRSAWHPRNVAMGAGMRRVEAEATIPDRPVMLPFSPVQRAQAGLGLAGKIQTAFYHYWSNPGVKDIWHHLHNGLGASFTHASDIGKLYTSQTATEVKTLVYDKGTGRKSKWVWIVPSKKSPDEMKQDHYLDADQMNLALALMDDRISLSKAILGGQQIVVPEPELEIA